MRYCYQCAVDNRWPWPAFLGVASRLRVLRGIRPLRGYPTATLIAANNNDLYGNHPVHSAIVVTMVVGLLQGLPAEIRQQVMSHFCRGCGTDALPCHCWNTE